MAQWLGLLPRSKKVLGLILTKAFLCWVCMVFLFLGSFQLLRLPPTVQKCKVRLICDCKLLIMVWIWVWKAVCLSLLAAWQTCDMSRVYYLLPCGSLNWRSGTMGGFIFLYAIQVKLKVVNRSQVDCFALIGLLCRTQVLHNNRDSLYAFERMLICFISFIIRPDTVMCLLSSYAATGTSLCILPLWHMISFVSPAFVPLCLHICGFWPNSLPSVYSSLHTSLHSALFTSNQPLHTDGHPSG